MNNERWNSNNTNSQLAHTHTMIANSHTHTQHKFRLGKLLRRTRTAPFCDDVTTAAACVWSFIDFHPRRSLLLSVNVLWRFLRKTRAPKFVKVLVLPSQKPNLVLVGKRRRKISHQLTIYEHSDCQASEATQFEVFLLELGGSWGGDEGCFRGVNEKRFNLSLNSLLLLLLLG